MAPFFCLKNYIENLQEKFVDNFFHFLGCKEVCGLGFILEGFYALLYLHLEKYCLDVKHKAVIPITQIHSDCV